MMWKSFVFAVCVGLLGQSAVALAATSSGQFIIDDPTTVLPVRGQTSSPSYTLDATIGSLVNSSASSPSFTVTSTQTQSSTTSSSSSSGGSSGGAIPLSSGGGAGSSAPAVSMDGQMTVDFNASCPIYRQMYRLQGSKHKDTVRVEVNGSEAGVSYPSPTAWYKVETFALGSTTLTIRGFSSRAPGVEQRVTVKRHFPGDVNGDSRIDDFDLSLIASHWEQGWCQGDFNTDGIVDDFDLSLLVSAWSK